MYFFILKLWHKPKKQMNIGGADLLLGISFCNFSLKLRHRKSENKMQTSLDYVFWLYDLNLVTRKSLF